MKVLSLFSGVGGFDLGLENAGMETVFQCEWDKHAKNILERHWPHVPKWTDVSTLTGAYVLQHAPVIDVVAWGSPCQDLSVAGKRAGLKGERSGLFHEGIRIIKEIRELTNGKYPRISVWENVAGALSSGAGADFGQVLYEMDEAGACFSEWRMLDAQYFGVPQRRRRVFVVSVFDPATAERCPNPLLPVSEGVRWNPSQGRTARETVAGTVEQSLASGRGIANTIPAELYHKSTVVNQDVNNGHLVVGSLAARDYKGVGNQYVNEGKLVVEAEPILIDGRRVDDVRVYDPPVQTLQERMGTGGNNVPVIGFSHTQGLSAQPSETAWPTLRTEGAGMAVAYSFDSLASNSMKSSNPHSGVNEVDVARTLDTARPDPSCNQGGIAIVEPIAIQDGREIEKRQNGLGVASEGEPSYTLDATGAQAVAYSIREDAKANTFSATEMDRANALNSLRPSPQSHHAQMFITEPTMSVRRLTPVECERLMGWPDNWTAGQSDTHRYKQCGNGVASPVAQWIGEQIINL